MLLKALYPYEGPFNGSLKFKANELFLKIRSENEYWHLVANRAGEIGCVPKNYVEAHEDQDVGSIADFAERALRSLNACKTKINNKNELLRVLRSLAQVCNGDSSDSEVQSIDEPNLETLSVSDKSQGSGLSHLQKSSLGKPTAPGFPISRNLASVLVDSLRLGTDASYTDCYQSFRLMVNLLATHIPGFGQYTQCLLDSSIDQNNEIYKQDSDWHLLNNHFKFLEQRSNNDHEFSWKLHDDKVDVERRLDHLIQLLQKANADLVKCFLTSDQFRRLSSLIEHYQRETIPTIKSRLLLVIGICSSLDTSFSQVTLNSALPGELIREIASSSVASDVHHISMCLRLLTMLLAQASALQVFVKSLLNEEFLSQVLGLIGPVQLSTPQNNLIAPAGTELFAQSSPSDQESIPKNNVLFGGRLAHAAAAFLLACNWHFCSIAIRQETPDKESSHVPLIKALLRHPNASQHFLELVVQAFNRCLDPVFRVNFKPLVSARRREFLMHWDYGLINSVTSDTTGGLISVNNSGLASLLTVINPTELDQPLLTLAEEDVGLYARSLWSDNLGTVTSQTTDPVQLPSCVASTTPHQSVIKFLYDVFSVKASSELVYRNDLNVIIDVIIRQLNNIRLPESEQVLDYCILLGLIVAHSDYVEWGLYKGRELIDALTVLLRDESAECTSSASDQQSLRSVQLILSRLRDLMKI
ncbi:NCK-interacting protein with SH3 domain [Fasciolopsis buskii]|uniref:NCK-interacting protein with SH3 domain n=1 Tax=Fasciolopsis buskii TaxID=27845 RepID=A0A8E0S030_9TREM|nr:NCK-interacting protein with SH3 domain [Fasciolopsis buski]